MNFCRYCEREVPGLEKVCKECFASRYDQIDSNAKSSSARLKAWHPIPVAPEERANGNSWVKVPLYYWLLFLAAGIVLYFLSYVFLWFFAALLAGVRVYLLFDRLDRSQRQSRPSALEMVLLLLGLGVLAATLLSKRISAEQQLRVVCVYGLLFYAYVFIERRRFE